MRFKRLNKGLVGFLSVSTLLGIRIPMAAYTQEGRQLLDIQPDANLQAQLGEVMHKLVDPKLTLADQLYAVGTLSDAAKDDERFFKQVLWFYDRLSREGRADDGIYLTMMLSILDVSRTTRAKVMVPYLDVEEKTLSVIVREFLRGVDSTGSPGVVDFSYYRFALGRDPSFPVVRYMYERDCGAALLELARSSLSGPGVDTRKQYRSIIWAEHAVSDVLWKQKSGFLEKTRVEPGAVVELHKLSKYDEWWVRLYVAEILRQHPAFRTPELVARLAADKHPLVREAMDFTKERPKAPPKPPAGKTAPP